MKKPTWGDILKELQRETEKYNNQVKQMQAKKPNTPINIPGPFDTVRRKHLTNLHKYTGRNTIVYASKWVSDGADPTVTSITAEDIQRFMEATSGLTGNSLDLIIHMPGGSVTAAGAIVDYLRTRFDDIRAFVPHAAMSAATMLACACNRIIMGTHSSLGPIDPQMPVNGRYIPAHAILTQFAQAKNEIQEDPGTLPVWLPILQQYGPALLTQCRLAQELSETFVESWLSSYMLASHEDREDKAKDIAAKLADHGEFKSHGRFISRTEARRIGLEVEDLEIDANLEGHILAVFHATMHTFSGTPAQKLFENHLEKAFIKQKQNLPAGRLLAINTPG